MLKETSDQVFEFAIKLHTIKPMIWRRIRVPKTFTFRQLHLAIQAAMGWRNQHCYDFAIKGKIISSKKFHCMNGQIDAMWLDMGKRKRPDVDEDAKIADYFVDVDDDATYVYDFGDQWKHKVILSKILPAEENVKYPMLVSGERACPPENCGGVKGFGEFLDILNNPMGAEQMQREWAYSKIDGPYDPMKFNKDAVKFCE